MVSRVISALDYRREPWRNALGWTREICRCGDEERWDWRLSIAEIDGDAPFSTFPGIDRELALLSGNGLQLRFDDGAEAAALSPPHGAHRFAGERALSAELADGPVQVFNLMWRWDRFSGSLSRRSLVGSMALVPEAGEVWGVHLLAGDARFGAETGLPTMSEGDTALLCGGADASVSYRLEGGGELLIARIRPA